MSANTLEIRLADLRSRFARARQEAQDVAASCLLAADELESRGTPPSEDDLASWVRLTGEMDALDKSIESERSGCGLESDAGNRDGFRFDSVERSLDELDEVRQRFGAVRQEIDGTLAIVEAALALKHVDDEGFAPLSEARRQASEIRDRLENWTGTTVPSEATALWSDAHPLFALTMLVADPDGFDDARWTTLNDAVSGAYGRAAATAVTRGRILLEPEAAARAREAARRREERDEEQAD